MLHSVYPTISWPSGHGFGAETLGFEHRHGLSGPVEECAIGQGTIRQREFEADLASSVNARPASLSKASILTRERASGVRLMHRPLLRNIVARTAHLFRNPVVRSSAGSHCASTWRRIVVPPEQPRSSSATPTRLRRRWEEIASGSGRRRLLAGSNALQIAVRLVELHDDATVDCGCRGISTLQRRRTELARWKLLGGEAGARCAVRSGHGPGTLRARKSSAASVQKTRERARPSPLL